VKSYSSQNWKIEHHCPQCGAPVLLEETDRLFSCPYCRVRLFISPPDHFRYFISPRAAASGKLIFIPYWRLKGIIFSIEGLEIASRIVDSSLLSLKTTALPFSLGIRPQVLKLRYVTAEVPGIFLKPALHFKHLALADLASPLREAAAAPHFGDIFVGEVVSLIYAPLILRGNSLTDAILDRPAGDVRDLLEDNLSASEPGAAATAGEGGGSGGDSDGISFIPTLCPNCGWDLDGERDSLVLFCRHCTRAWQARRGGLQALSFSFLRTRGETAVCLPFWRLRAKVSGLSLKSYSDLIRLANLPVAPRARNDLELYFWAPAFKTHPNLFLRLARSLTILQREPDMETEPPKSPLFPATLPVSEALEGLKAMVASMAVPRKSIFPLLPQIEFSLEDHMLAYLPFAERGEELIQTEMGTSIQKNALKWGRLI
jgi:DNA-directed RNA polymerase subunit RPC12/RpoP